MWSTRGAPLRGARTSITSKRTSRGLAAAGIDIDDLGAKLQDEGAKSFVSSWNDLMEVIASKSASLAKAG